MVKLKSYNTDAHEALKEIYRDGGGRENLSSFSRRPRRRGRLALVIGIVVLAIAAAAAIAGLYVFSPHTKFSGSAVTVAITGSASVVSGDNTTWTLAVRNDGAVALKNAAVSVQYPEGFQFVSAQPAAANQFGNSWTLGDVKANGSQEIKLTGRLIGDVGSKANISATLTYTPANFSSEFQATGSLDVTIMSSTLGIDVKAPTTIASGQAVEYAITISNTSSTKLTNIRVTVDYPSALTDVTTKPAPSSATTWDIPSLDPEKTSSISVKGTLTGSPNSVAELGVHAGVVNAGGSFIVQRETTALVLFLEPTLNVTMTVGGKSTIKPANPGDSLKVVLAYENASDAVFTNASVSLQYACKDSDGASVDCLASESIKSGTAFTRDAKDQTILRWTKDAIPDLARLVPSAKGTIDLTVPIKKSLRSVGSGKNFTVTLTPIVRADDSGSGTPFDKMLDAVSIKVNTELRLAVEGRYYSEEGGAVGSGPLPPQAGATTQYQIAWFVTNTMNSVQNVLLKAILPEGVAFVSASETSGNSITYDSTTREVRWRIDKIDAGVGQSLPTLVGTFTISITPTAADVGNVLPLLGATSGTAADAFTGASLKVTGDAVTTNLAFDSQAAGKGTVIEAQVNTNSAINSNTNTAQ